MTGPPDMVSTWLEPERTFSYIKGRVALYAILKAAGIGPGDEVVIPGFTCVVVPAAVTYTGARPVFHDIDPLTYNGDPALAASCLSPRSRAVIVQHTFGVPAQLGDLPGRCHEKNLLLIEDCAHAIGARLDGRPVGTIGDAAFCSLQWSKPVTTGLGGIARINTDWLRDRVAEQYAREFHEPGLVDSAFLVALSRVYRRYYRPDLYWRVRGAYRWIATKGLVPGSSSTPELTCPEKPAGYSRRFGRGREGQIGKVLRTLPAQVAHSRRVAARYAERLAALGAFLGRVPPGATVAPLRFPVLVRDRELFLRESRRMRLEIGDWFNSPLHPSECRSECFGYRPGACPIAETTSRHVINLPTHTRVDDKTVDRVMDYLESRRGSILSRHPALPES
ncbi:MAG: DegT/DnrJ/EryC1/StrS family aminotransferase [Acidobacteriota bacterium]